MANSKLFEKNRELWGLRESKDALKLSFIDVRNHRFCKSENGEVNLKKKENKKQFFLIPIKILLQIMQLVFRLRI